MKIFIVVLFAAATLAAQAQDVETETPPDPSETFVPQIVYEAPVLYTAPVIYQASVAYFAPVYYLTQPPGDEVCPEPSTVVYIGGHRGVQVQETCGDPGSTVFHFGVEQAQAHGYQFNRPR
jgi:hypothetical protein